MYGKSFINVQASVRRAKVSGVYSGIVCSRIVHMCFIESVQIIISLLSMLLGYYKYDFARNNYQL